MYSDLFCRVYNEFGWNYFPEAFGEALMEWMKENELHLETGMDLACGTGVLCAVLRENGILASGTDLSEGMIRTARENYPGISFEVADMITFRSERRFDLVTCTGDALNHIHAEADLKRVFENVYAYLNRGGYFVFDLLNEAEIPSEEPFELDFDEHTRAVFCVTRETGNLTNLRIMVYEDGVYSFEENIREKLHDRERVQELLKAVGFEVCRFAHSLTENSAQQGTTYYGIAKKP